VTDEAKIAAQPSAEGLAGKLTSMANGLRGSKWAKRDEIIALLDEDVIALKAQPSIEAVERGEQ
jgi:hypothetical protein